MEVERRCTVSGNPRGTTLHEFLRRADEVESRVEVQEHSALDLRDANDDVRLERSVRFVLSFHNLCYRIKVSRKVQFGSLVSSDDTLRTPEFPQENPGIKTLLNDVSGEAREGEIMAVLGASGAGKSTLVDALANRIAKGSLKGSVKLNGEILESKLSKTISAYVMQDDLLFPMLTVQETLMFSAELRLPRDLDKSRKAARVQALIDQLGLRSAAGTVIGDEGHRGVSGGERRRVSIGVDIIHDPIILFLDEPTSGLDSTSAFMVVKVLKRIAQSGSLVIMTVHQPSFRILNQIDSLIFLSRGQSVYTGSPADLPAFLADFGRPIPLNDDRTEFVLDLIRDLETSPGGIRTIVEFNRSWKVSEFNSKGSDNGERTRVGEQSLREAITSSISQGKLVASSSIRNNDSISISTVSSFANPIWKETVVIGRRSMLNARRMPELFAIRLGAVVVTGIILATVFWKLDDSPRGVQERLGFFAFAMSTTFYTCADALPVFLQERYIFMRETSYNAYRRSSYVIAQSIIAIPALVFLSFVFSVTTFWSVGLAGGIKGFLFYYVTILAAFWAGSSFVTFLSGVVSHVMLGFTVVVAVLAYFLLFSGFFVGRTRIPHYWIWFHYISLVKYPYEAVLQNEFGDSTRCYVKGMQIFDQTPLAQLPEVVKGEMLQRMSGVLGLNVTESTCVMTGRNVLEEIGVTDLGKWSCIWIILSFGLFFRLLFYIALVIGSRNKRV